MLVAYTWKFIDFFLRLLGVWIKWLIPTTFVDHWHSLFWCRKSYFGLLHKKWEFSFLHPLKTALFWKSAVWRSLWSWYLVLRSAIAFLIDSQCFWVLKMIFWPSEGTKTWKDYLKITHICLLLVFWSVFWSFSMLFPLRINDLR